METIYRADDGTIFEDEEECEEYENSQRMKDSSLSECKVWDDKFNLLEISTIDDSWINHGHYYYAPTDEAKYDMNDLFKYFGYDPPFDSDSYFMFPNHNFSVWGGNDHYYDAEKEYQKLKALRTSLAEALVDSEN